MVLCELFNGTSEWGYPKCSNSVSGWFGIILLRELTTMFISISDTGGSSTYFWTWNSL